MTENTYFRNQDQKSYNIQHGSSAMPLKEFKPASCPYCYDGEIVLKNHFLQCHKCLKVVIVEEV